jgi:hypothetical protein
MFYSSNFILVFLQSGVSCIYPGLYIFPLQIGFQSSTNIMEPRKAPNKSEEVAESSSSEGDIISDTTPHAIYSIKSWRQIFETLEYEIKNFPDDSENKQWDIEESKLHKVATRP